MDEETIKQDLRCSCCGVVLVDAISRLGLCERCLTLQREARHPTTARGHFFSWIGIVAGSFTAGIFCACLASLFYRFVTVVSFQDYIEAVSKPGPPVNSLGPRLLLYFSYAVPWMLIGYGPIVAANILFLRLRPKGFKPFFFDRHYKACISALFGSPAAILVLLWTYAGVIVCLFVIVRVLKI